MWSLAQESTRTFTHVALSDPGLDTVPTAVLTYEIMLWAETVHCLFPDLYQVIDTRNPDTGLWQVIIYISDIPTANTDPFETISNYTQTRWC